MYVSAAFNVYPPPLLEQKPSTATEYVAAHLSKIHGLDWHPDNEFILATSSQDNSVRVRLTDAPEHITLGELGGGVCRIFLRFFLWGGQTSGKACGDQPGRGIRALCDITGG